MRLSASSPMTTQKCCLFWPQSKEAGLEAPVNGCILTTVFSSPSPNHSPTTTPPPEVIVGERGKEGKEDKLCCTTGERRLEGELKIFLEAKEGHM